MAATASAPRVAPVIDTSAGIGHISKGRSVLPFLRLPRELRDQVRSRLQKQFLEQQTRSATRAALSQPPDDF
jgi:hypothetical protein